MCILLFPNRPAVGKCSAFQELVVYVCNSDVVVVPYKSLSPDRPEHEEYTEEKDTPHGPQRLDILADFQIEKLSVFP